MQSVLFERHPEYQIQPLRRGQRCCLVCRPEITNLKDWGLMLKTLPYRQHIYKSCLLKPMGR